MRVSSSSSSHAYSKAFLYSLHQSLSSIAPGKFYRHYPVSMQS